MRRSPWPWLFLLLCLVGFPATAQVNERIHALVQVQSLHADDAEPPADDRPWSTIALPDIASGSPASLPSGTAAGATWYRAVFDAPEGTGDWAVYLPYLYNGGQFWLNGQRVAEVAESDAERHVRWDRPHLVPLPPTALRSAANVLAIRAAVAGDEPLRRFPRIQVGPEAELQPVDDRRLFWVRTMPQITAVVCLLVSVFVLFIWWRRRAEVLYGLFGLAALLWGMRTLTFVVEQVPADRWLAWRVLYLAATGGFIVVMAIFTMQFVGLRKVRIERAMTLYAVIGPLWLLLQGVAAEPLVNRVWTAGLIPIGLAILVLSLWHMARERTVAAAVLPAALVIAVVAGVHDYAVAWDAGGIARLWPAWAAERIFLLHHAANLLLVTMGGLLTLRFIHTLAALEDLNQTLEAKVDDRERALADNFARMAALQQQTAAAQERQLIMREIHDGLGSRLFTSLSRVERGDMDGGQIADALRGCIADMRLALDALAPDQHDFHAAWSSFRHRWQGQLEEAGVQPSWTLDLGEDQALELPPKAALQWLRVAQEALTNVLKHARATRVAISLRRDAGFVELEVADNGQAAAGARANRGRGMVNMQARARQLQGLLELEQDAGGTRVRLRAPVQAGG